jgi:hypothetical protein
MPVLGSRNLLNVDDPVKCTRCKFTALIEAFPIAASGLGRSKTCAKCTEKIRGYNHKARESNKENGVETSATNSQPTLIKWENLIVHLEKCPNGILKNIDLLIQMPIDEESEATNINGATRRSFLAAEVRRLTGYRFK